METARAEVAENGGLDQAATNILLTVSASEHSARASIAWADEALADVEKLHLMP